MPLLGVSPNPEWDAIPDVARPRQLRSARHKMMHRSAQSAAEPRPFTAKPSTTDSDTFEQRQARADRIAEELLQGEQASRRRKGERKQRQAGTAMAPQDPIPFHRAGRGQSWPLASVVLGGAGLGSWARARRVAAAEALKSGTSAPLLCDQEVVCNWPIASTVLGGAGLGPWARARRAAVHWHGGRAVVQVFLHTDRSKEAKFLPLGARISDVKHLMLTSYCREICLGSSKPHSDTPVGVERLWKQCWLRAECQELCENSTLQASNVGEGMTINLMVMLAHAP